MKDYRFNKEKYLLRFTSPRFTSPVQSSPVQSSLSNTICRAKGLGKLVRYIKGSLYWGAFPYIYYYWAEEYRSLYRGLRCIEVR